jgi:hypothetical protein
MGQSKQWCRKYLAYLQSKDYVELSFSKIFWGIIEEEPPHVWKRRFRNGVRWAKVKYFWPQHVANLEEEFDFKGCLLCYWLEKSTSNSDHKNHCGGLETKKIIQ